MGSSKLLTKDVRMKMAHFHQEGEDYKNSSFKLLISIVRNIIRKWKRNGTVEVKARSGQTKKMFR